MGVSSTVNKPTQKGTSLRERFIRFGEMIPCKTAFIDARTPGSDKKENFCLIGEGVTENPDQVTHIDLPHGFNIGAARQPNGCKNSHHSHDTEEVFMIFSGEWKFTWGENGEDGETILSAGDTISLPPHMFRGFENVGDDGAFMFSILGLNETGSAGHVVWAPYVFEQAKDYGLVLLEDGRLIDTAEGKEIPEDGIAQASTTKEQVEAMNILTVDDMLKCVANQSELSRLCSGGLSKLSGITEYAVIGPENPLEEIGAGKMDWHHGFVMRRILIEPGSKVPAHNREEEEVIIIQSGELEFCSPEGDLTMRSGDLLTVPIGLIREFINNQDITTDLIVVRRGNRPKAANFTS